jgi:hypothetical protein
MSKIDDVRGHLMKALEGLSSGTMDIERAKAIAEVSQTLINSAKVEVDYLKVTGQQNGTGFLEKEDEQLPPGITGITKHRLTG